PLLSYVRAQPRRQATGSEREGKVSAKHPSEPLHSSCTRTANGRVGSVSAATGPTMYTVSPPMGGKNTSRSGRVTSSGNMPPVCSNRVRRKQLSSTPKRLATPDRYHTHSIGD